MTWLPLQDARQITGHDTVSGLDQWVRRWNRDNPAHLVMRYSGKVDSVSLRSAFRQYVQQRTPGSAVRAAANNTLVQINKKRSRSNGPAHRKVQQ